MPVILVVDDDALCRDLIREVAESAGHRVFEAADAPAGFGVALERTPDLMVVDVLMPGEDGLSLLARLQADPRTIDIPVLIVSQKTGVTDVMAGLAAGALDYIDKPFRPREILNAIRAALPRPVRQIA